MASSSSQPPRSPELTPLLPSPYTQAGHDNDPVQVPDIEDQSQHNQNGQEPGSDGSSSSLREALLPLRFLLVTVALPALGLAYAFCVVPLFWRLCFTDPR